VYRIVKHCYYTAPSKHIFDAVYYWTGARHRWSMHIEDALQYSSPKQAQAVLMRIADNNREHASVEKI